MECWIEPEAYSPEKAVDIIGKALREQVRSSKSDFIECNQINIDWKEYSIGTNDSMKDGNLEQDSKFALIPQ
jgi:hypothetical protein